MRATAFESVSPRSQRLADVGEHLAESIVASASARSVSMASMIGMPARTKAASWREKFMISARLTFFFVISIFQQARAAP